MRLLLAEDESAMSEALEDILTYHRYVVDTVDNGEDALEYARSGGYDGIILDIMMPDVDGLQFCHEIRDQVDCPILFITAKPQEADIVQGLTYGADDYICKPFGVKELQARVAAHLRREHRERHHKLLIENIQFDLSAQELYVENQLLDLTRSEYRICQFLAENKGQVFSKEQIYTHLYGYEDKGSPTAVAEHIKNIRAKLKNVGQNPIETVWGIGYKWH